jgi:hypothetical protein
MRDAVKLKVLIEDYYQNTFHQTGRGLAYHLLANGVTFATDNNVGGKWIPVTEQEEPTEDGTYLCHGYWFGSGRKQTETADFFGEWNIANNFILTHWMPLPEPPMRKGENG